ncbi:polyprenyl synthetase family protein [Psychrobacter frigidicola]|uniref:Polyprenyl synthetase family protein n=1 Tax=Psychrobacter frigidicola TaxID=45611 RepID=A0A5C6ZZ07_9GAMM|nr:polyprenyl synthetase family protein [Psychrobacter frigidicola]TXD96058.1 polyprenyl synthetase family protein [Psychrobacter frigidicola]
MTVSSAPRFTSFTSFESFSHALRVQLAQDIDVLFAYADLPSPLNDACRYVMNAQGKLVRPLLVASSFVSVNTSNKQTPNNVINSAFSDAEAINSIVKDNGLDAFLDADSHFDMCRRAALAVELLHTYSLVHDDLPCMDDDELRRGQPTAHIVFDEATALLAGDVLQTLAFEVLTAELPTFASFDAPIASQLLAVFAPRARRMVAGQMLDINAEATSNITQNELEDIHRDKTGALIEAAILMGGICGGATAPQRIALQDCAQHIGLAFQVQDDILDVTASTDDLGKPAGSDEKLDKSTYVKLMGVDAAKGYAQSLFNNGRAAIIRELINNSDDVDSDINDITDNAKSNALLELIDWLWSRKK